MIELAQGPLPPLPVADFLFWNEVVIPLAGMAVAVILGFPIIRAVVRRLERRSAEASSSEVAALRSEVAELKGRLADMEDASHRMAELEERLDFTERILTQQRQRAELGSAEGQDAGRLPGGT